MASRNAIALAVLAAAGLAVAGCREPRLDNLAARELSNPETRHPISTSSRTEALLVEVAPSGEGLSPNQETDVYRFVERYKSEGTGTLKIAAPGSAKGHLNASRSVRQIEGIVASAGIPARAVEQHRGAGGKHAGAVKLAYERPVAVAPQCGDWPEDLGQNRERLIHPDFGCAHQRNLALTVANARDLSEPQEETPRSSEVRSSHWGRYIGKTPLPGQSGGGGGSPAGGATAPAGAKGAAP